LKILYNTNKKKSISVKIFESNINEYRLNRFIKDLDYINKNTFNNNLVINIINHKKKDN